MRKRSNRLDRLVQDLSLSHYFNFPHTTTTSQQSSFLTATAIMQQQEEIEKEVRESQALTSDLLDLKETLEGVYKEAHSVHFATGIQV